MINLKYAAAGAVLAMGISSAADATVYVLDDFSGPPQEAFMFAPSSTVGNRTLSISILAQGGTTLLTMIDPYASISGGTMQISNGAFDDSDVDLSYAINDASWADLTSLKLDFLDNDNALPDPSSVTLTIGADTVGTIFLPDSDTPFQIAFNISDAISAQFASGITDVRFTFSGSPEFDMALDQIIANVPEPGMIGLFGLGLAGIGMAMRRRRNA